MMNGDPKDSKRDGGGCGVIRELREGDGRKRLRGNDNPVVK